MLNLDQDHPTIIPTSNAIRILQDQNFGFVKTLGAEWIAPCQSSQFTKKVMRVNVASPCRSHWLANCRVVGLGKNALDTSEVGDIVVAVVPEILYQLLLTALGGNISLGKHKLGVLVEL